MINRIKAYIASLLACGKAAEADMQPCNLPTGHGGACAGERDFNNENKGGWSHG